MANIATVAAVAILRDGVPRGRVTSHGLLRAMTHHFGQSYCVPAWSFDNYPAGHIYTQHGEKWSPTGVVEAWRSYAKFLKQIYVRWYDDGGDHDIVFGYDADGFGSSVPCRYGFDAMRVTRADGLETCIQGDDWRAAGPGVYEAKVCGSYLAANDRSDLRAFDPSIPSRTTPVRGQMLCSGTLRWRADDMPTVVARLEQAVLSEATSTDFFWQGRLVRSYQLRGNRWWMWCLDDWDNCVDSQWIAKFEIKDSVRLF